MFTWCRQILMKYFLLLSLTFLTSGPVLGQQQYGIGWGFKGGLNASGAQTDNTLIVRNDSKLGWQAGVFSRTTVAGWGYQAEARVNTLGSVQQFGDEQQRNTLGYLTLPIALQYVTASNWSFLLGGYASFRLWARRKSSKPGVGDFTANIKDNVAFMDYGAWAGVGYRHQRFLFELSYWQGIPNINTNAQINARVTNASGQLSIGYFLN